MRKRIFSQKCKRKKKGSSAIEFVIALLFFVLFFAFTVDLAQIINKQYVVGQYSQSIVRTVAVQGGISQGAPTNFPDGSRGYRTSLNVYNQVATKLKDSAKIDSFDVYLTSYNENGDVTSMVTLNPGTTFVVDYQKRFEIEVRYRYKWTITSQMVPGLSSTVEKKVRRSGVSEYKYNYDDWGGK